MSRQVMIGEQGVGEDLPVYIVAEIGINHNGNLKIAKQLIDVALLAGCNAVKFQKRDPEESVPYDQKGKMRDTPWGYISYLEYRQKLEFWQEEYDEIDMYCRERGIIWFASCWDIPSIDFVASYAVPCLKVPSACLIDDDLLTHVRSKGVPIVLSTGMSTVNEIQHAVQILGEENLIMLHATSTYPCPPEELNLRMIPTLKQMFNCPVGYSGHEVGLASTAAAVALGATMIERHVTLDHTIWGTDQAASVATVGLIRLVKYIRGVEQALGTGVKEVYESELTSRERLRKIKELES